MKPDFRHVYGPWALVAGASEGLGAAFAGSLASRGCNLILLARRADRVEQVAEQCRARHGVEVIATAADLADETLEPMLARLFEEHEIGLVVYNAASAPLGSFADLSARGMDQVVDVNVRGPLRVVRAAIPSMCERKRGAIILMSSLAGNQGSPRIATYAASKSFNTVLAEGLWHELRPRGIHVLACVAGAIRTPGFQSASRGDAPGTLDPEDVAEAALCGIGKGPIVIPGAMNRLAAFLMRRVFSRRQAIRIMAASTKELSNG